MINLIKNYRKLKANDEDFIDKCSKIAKQATSTSAVKSIDKTNPETSYNVSVPNKYSPMENDEEKNKSTRPTEPSATKLKGAD